MEQLGLGVRLELDDDMTQEINPIIRDLERLRNQATRTTNTFNDMRNAHNPFGRNRRQDIQDYYASMQSADRVLLSVSDRLILATKSANALSRAVNRTQFAGNFNVMYRDMVRVQTMLGQMGYGMSKMQRDMSNLRAFNMMDVQIKDLQDRIKLTTQALKEMQSSPDASKMTKEIDVAKRALQAYRNELSKVGSLQNKLAETHGLGYMKAGGRDVLYEQENNVGQNAQNRIAGMLMGDVAVASAIAYSSLSRTADMLVGVGNTALEAKQKLTQMSTAMTTLGMTLTTTLSLVSALAMGGWGYLAHSNEKANAQFTGQTLMPINGADTKPYQASMRNVYANSSGSDRESIARMFSTMSNAGISDQTLMRQISGGANEIAYAQGTDQVETLNSVMRIARETGHSYAESLDLISVGLKSTNGDLEGATEAVLANAGAFKDANGQWRNAFETIDEGNKDGSINRLIQAVKGLANTLTILWDNGMKQIVGGIGTLVTKVTNATNAFLRAHPAVAKFMGSMLGLALVVGLVVGPILLVTGFLLKFRSAIGGVGLAIQALSARGGVAVLGAQSTMLAKNVHSATVALARFPQTLLFGVIPAIYSAVRMLPGFILNMARLNPVMTALTVGMFAYSQNWFGFGDTVKGAVEKIKSSVGVAKGIVGTAMTGGDINLESYGKFEQILAKTMGTARVAKSVITSIFTGEDLKFSIEETNLVEKLGISNLVSNLAVTGQAVKSFVDGFVSGIELVYNKAKTFVGWMRDTFEPVITGMANFLSKLFGGEGNFQSVEDIMASANGLNKTMSDLGRIAGVALTALLGFKLIKPLLGGMFTGLVKNPFGGIISSANNARKAIRDMSSSVGQIGGNITGAVNRATGGAGAVPPVSNRDRATASVTGARALGGGQFGTVLRDRNGNPTSTVLNRTTPPPMTDRQRRQADILTTNANARDRGYDVDAQSAIRRTGQQGALRTSFRVNRDGTYNNSSNANLNGQQVHQRRQGTLSRALFGQAYDVYGQDGRRTEINRQGGLLRRASSDNNMGERMALRDRVSLAGENVRQRATTMGQSAMSNVRSAGTALANTAGGQRVASAGRAVANVGRTAMKPVSVPVNYIMGRLQTAGIVRQGQQAGQQSGNRFTRAFNMASRGIGAGGRMFSGAVRGATSAGRTAGSGMLKGMNVVSKGIGGIFKVGLRAIPFLGWALMAWDIISTVFTNWDKIKAGAQTAWTWIKTEGVNALGQAWEWIKSSALGAWNWIQANGATMASTIASNVISFIGNAFTTILGLAGQALAWILTDGIAKAVQLGASFIQWVAFDAFPKIVSFAVSALTGLISTAGSIAMSIGSAMWNGITSALSGIGDWIGEKVSSAVSWVGGLFGGGDSKKDKKKYARGGIINSPHMGIVGEAGPEAIIPLSGNQRDRAKNLLTHTAGVLGMQLAPKGMNGGYSEVVNTPNVINKTLSTATTNVNNESSNVSIQNNNNYNSVNNPMPRLYDQAVEVNPIVNPVKESPVVIEKPVVRNNNTQGNNSQDKSGGSQDNSVTINNVHINLPQGAQADATSGRKVAQSLAKELQRLIKQERMRSNGKNLTLEDLLLNM